MAQPTLKSVHVDAILTNISVAFTQAAVNFVAPQVFPLVPVDKKSDVYFFYTQEDWFRDEAAPRKEAAESEGSGYNLTTDNYSCEVYAIHKDIGYQTRQNADNPLNLDRDATEFVTQRLLLRQERQWVNDYFATTIWGNDVTPTNLWSDFTSSDPISDIDLGKETILKNTGQEANTLVLGYQVYRQLIRHPDFRDQIKYTSPENINADLLAKILDIDRVLVSKAVYTTTKEKNATPAYAFAAGKNALLCHVAERPGLLVPSAGYAFAWKGISGGMGQNIAISRFYLPQLKVDRIEGESAWVNKVVAKQLGYFFNGAVA